VKLGLFGGTFDPVHNAHLFVAEAARIELGLERVVFLPTSRQHYRTGAVAPIAHRLAMLRGAIASNPAFAIDETDLDESATGFTADLLPRIRARFPDAAFTFIAGQDSLVDSPWRRFDDVLGALEAFAIAPRRSNGASGLPAFVASLPEGARRKIVMLDLPMLYESASVVRDRLARGQSIRYLVPDVVARYIGEHDVYV
jgi:nicotinate-nucleotide adenylyltransferase